MTKASELDTWCLKCNRLADVDCDYAGHPLHGLPLAVIKELRRMENENRLFAEAIDEWQSDYKSNENERSHLANVVVKQQQQRIETLEGDNKWLREALAQPDPHQWIHEEAVKAVSNLSDD